MTRKTQKKRAEIAKLLVDVGLKEAPRQPYCPECLSLHVGEENKGEGYCYACGFQWVLP